MKIILMMAMVLLLSCVNKGSQGVQTFPCSNKNEVIALAESEWLKVYGENIYSKKPFIAFLKDSI